LRKRVQKGERTARTPRGPTRPRLITGPGSQKDADGPTATVAKRRLHGKRWRSLIGSLGSQGALIRLAPTAGSRRPRGWRGVGAWCCEAARLGLPTAIQRSVAPAKAKWFSSVWARIGTRGWQLTSAARLATDSRSGQRPGLRRGRPPRLRLKTRRVLFEEARRRPVPLHVSVQKSPPGRTPVCLSGLEVGKLKAQPQPEAKSGQRGSESRTAD
jgi:hypothetical protein